MIRFIKNILPFKKLTTKGNLKIVALCFLTACSFWLVKKLNKRYNTKMRIPIVFDYNKEKIYSRNKIPNVVWVDAQSTGWILLQHKLGLKNDPIVFHIGNFFETSLSVGKEDLRIFINNNIKGVSINQILEDNLYLEFENIKSKKISLSLDKTFLVLAKNQRVEKFKITPSSIILNGPYSYLHNINSKYTVKFNVDTTNPASLQTYYCYPTFDSSITSNPSKVKVELFLTTK